MSEAGMVTVWAPCAEQVDLLRDGSAYALAKSRDGWWRCEMELRAGEDYRFLVDGESLPDPRSPWQPEGVHGPSRHVDHASFRWTDSRWQPRPLSSAIIYELHIGTFTAQGTFDAAIERLDHLVNLGVTHVELMPVAEFLGARGWGYDGVYPFAPHHAYGGPEGLKRFVNACHEKGLAVLLDVVYNHLGPSGNYLPRFGPYFSDRHCTPWGPALNFDGPHSDFVRRYFCDNALMWLRDYHFDGLRLDAVHAIIDTSAVPFLEQLSEEVDELEAHLGRHFILIAESDLNDPRIVRPREIGGFGLDAQWSDDIHHALHSALTGERDGYYADFGSLHDLAIAMTQPYVYSGKHSEFRKRRHGRPATNISAHRFLAYVQNHDQLGNRCQGDRLCHLVNADRAKIGAALVLMSPYVPMLFQGEEWGACTPFQFFVDFSSEPELAAAVQSGRAKEFAAFGWKPSEIPNPNDVETFLRSKLDWSELARPEHADQLGWYRSLIALRKTLPALTSGRLDQVDVVADEAACTLVVQRAGVTVACNFSKDPKSIRFDEEATGKLLIASKRPLSAGEGAIVLPGESVAVFGSGDHANSAAIRSAA